MFWLDKTPIASGTGRGEEIGAWLAEHAMSSYVTIDDHVDMGSLRSHLIVTHSAQGLQRAAAPRGIATLPCPVR
jgi:hypothetical protein